MGDSLNYSITCWKSEARPGRFMIDNSESDKFADFTHQFHEKYRASGIALCISLAAVASAESWWFYGLFKDVKNACNPYQILLWYIVIISAVLLFASSFVRKRQINPTA